MDIINSLRYIEIETCSNCTRSCKWCLFGAYPGFRPLKNTLLETDTIVTVLEDLKRIGFHGLIALYSINEPLLDPRIRSGELISLVRSILSEKVTISITTNGDLLDRQTSQLLFSCGLSRLKISCYDNASIEKAKIIQAEFNHVVILDQRRYLQGAFESNRGGSINSLRNLNICFGTCFMPSFRSVIGWDGNVRICPHEMLGRIVLGNVYEKNLSEILTDERNTALRYKIRTNRKNIFPCNLCNIDGNESYMRKHME